MSRIKHILFFKLIRLRKTQDQVKQLINIRMKEKKIIEKASYISITKTIYIYKLLKI